jgi:hypothetical protein
MPRAGNLFDQAIEPCSEHQAENTTEAQSSTEGSRLPKEPAAGTKGAGSMGQQQGAGTIFPVLLCVSVVFSGWQPSVSATGWFGVNLPRA